MFSYPNHCFCCYRVFLLRFSCHFRPRPESATFLATVCNVMSCFRQTNHLDRSCCVFESISTDTSSRSIMLCFRQTHRDDVNMHTRASNTPNARQHGMERHPLKRPVTTPFNTGTIIMSLSLSLFHGPERMQRHVVFSTDTPSRSIMLCFRQTHRAMMIVMM